MNDVRAQMLGAVTPPLRGEQHTPSREELFYSHPEAVTVSFCTGCGFVIDLTLDHANDFMERAGLPHQTQESLAGKYIQRNNCIMCAVKGDDPGFQIMDIPHSD